MKRIIVIGCPGSGKTTFSLKLSEKLGTPLFHLDSIWHKADRTHISREEFDMRLDEIMAQDNWIIDGNYNRTLEKRIAACDTVILFDLPIALCLEGAYARLGKERCDMPWSDNELDPWLKKKIEDFSTESLPTIYEILNKYKNDRKEIVFKSREAAEIFLINIQDIR